MDETQKNHLISKVRLMAPALAAELKEEWRACERYCKERRLENSRNAGNKAQGVSESGAHQEQMKLPRLAQFALDKRYPDGEWIGNTEAMDWAWKQWPQFRLIETKSGKRR